MKEFLYNKNFEKEVEANIAEGKEIFKLLGSNLQKRLTTYSLQKEELSFKLNTKTEQLKRLIDYANSNIKGFKNKLNLTPENEKKLILESIKKWEELKQEYQNEKEKNNNLFIKLLNN